MQHDFFSSERVSQERIFFNNELFSITKVTSTEYFTNWDTNKVATYIDLGDLYAESGQALQGSFSAVSKQASKQARSISPSRRKRKEKRPRYARQILQVNTRWN